MHFFKGKKEQVHSYFYKLPQEFTKYSERETLAYCLGATLYMPATKPNIYNSLFSDKLANATSIVMDLEDAIGELQVADALQNIKKTLQQVAMNDVDVPLLFVRLRNCDQFATLAQFLGPLQHYLTGYMMPKFSLKNADVYLNVLKEQRELGYELYGLPILESEEIIYKEKRLQILFKLRKKLIDHYDAILNVRIGTTDMSGVYGIRRKLNQSLYDIQVVRDCVGEILNVFSRPDHPFIVSGSVWEYFDSPTTQFDGTAVLTKVRSAAITGLMKELEYDKLNGLIGKTIIHPTHIDIVNAMYSVTYEEYSDALEIIANQTGEIGVKKSTYANKMNEMKPHLHWAKKILTQAHVYGVLKPEATVDDLI